MEAPAPAEEAAPPPLAPPEVPEAEAAEAAPVLAASDEQRCCARDVGQHAGSRVPCFRRPPMEEIIATPSKVGVPECDGP